MPTKKHTYAGLPSSENHASQGKKVHTNTRNSAFPRALPCDLHTRKICYTACNFRDFRSIKVNSYKFAMFLFYER